MPQTMSDIPTNGSLVSPKLQLVKLIFIMITLIFTLTVTFMVSEDKSALSKMDSVLEMGITAMSRERKRCLYGSRLNLTSNVFAILCELNSTVFIDIRHFGNEMISDSGILLNLKQWQVLKSKIDSIDEFCAEC